MWQMEDCMLTSEQAISCTAWVLSGLREQTCACP